jgi:hypothetical protein
MATSRAMSSASATVRPCANKTVQLVRSREKNAFRKLFGLNLNRQFHTAEAIEQAYLPNWIKRKPPLG